MTTRFVLTPESAQFPSANFPQLTTIHSTERILVLAFDPTTQETCQWRGIAPQGVTGTWTAIITYAMASGVSGGVAFDVSVQAVSNGDALDIDASVSFDTVNGGSDASVPGTAGYIEQISITLNNMDSVSAGDWITFRVARDVADANDTAAGDAYVLSVEVRDGA